MDDVVAELKRRQLRNAYKPNFDNHISFGNLIGQIVGIGFVIWILHFGDWALVKFAWIILKMAFWIMGGFLFMDSPL